MLVNTKRKKNQIKNFAIFITLILLVFFIHGLSIQAMDIDKKVLFITTYSENYDSIQQEIKGIQSGLGENAVLDMAYLDINNPDTLGGKQLFYETQMLKLKSLTSYDAVIAGDDHARDFVTAHQNGLFPQIPLIFLARGDAVERPLIDEESFGQISGGLVSVLLSGQPVEAVDYIEKTPDYYAVSYDLLNQDVIDGNLIPIKTVLLNEEAANHEKFWNISMAVGIIVIFLMIVSIILIVDNLKRRSIQNELTESNEKLKTIYQELAATEEKLRYQYEVTQKNALEVGILHEKYAIATGITNSAVWELDLVNHEVMLSDNFAGIVNRTIAEKENIFKLLNTLLDEQHKERLLHELDIYLSGETAEINVQVPVKDGADKLKWILIRGKSISPGNEKVKRLHGILMDTTKMKEQEEYIAFMASHDYLTKLPNRMRFLEKLSMALKTGKSGAVCLFDIDNFKGINDTLGHVYGDELLKIIAERLTRMTDENMFISRLGGDEFLIMIENTSNQVEIEDYAKRIKNAFQEAFRLEGKDNFISISMGITCFPDDSNNIDQLIMNADTAMYYVKHGDKNNYIFYQEDMKDSMDTKIEIEEILREALIGDGFKLVYQPQVDLATGRIDGFEALLRLKDHAICPDLFIPVGEETGLIINMGRWVAKEAIEQFVRWRTTGFGEKTIAINFSTRQLRDKDFIHYLERLLTANHVKPEYLEIEITESILLENNTMTMGFLHDLKAAGFKIALDDFGTGYSSLNYLTYIPVDKVKLDKSINDKFLNLENNKVMDSLISLAHSLSLTITAEGIEEWDQYLRLKTGGCDFIQGYLFGRPLDPGEVEKIYNKNSIETARLIREAQ